MRTDGDCMSGYGNSPDQENKWYATGVPSSRLEKAKNYLSIYRRLAKAKN